MRSQAWETANGTGGAGFVVSVIAGINWPQIAAMLAAIYSALLICDWLYRKIKGWRAKRG